MLSKLTDQRYKTVTNADPYLHIKKCLNSKQKSDIFFCQPNPQTHYLDFKNELGQAGKNLPGWVGFPEPAWPRCQGIKKPIVSWE